MAEIKWIKLSVNMFDDEKIKVEGKVESKEVTVLLLDPGITIDSYSGGDVSFEKS